MPVDVHADSRRLRSRCEAIFGAMWLTPEWRHGGHGLSRAQWYMAGRAAPLGRVEAEVASAVLGTFDLSLVQAGIDGVWAKVSPGQVAWLKVETAVEVMNGLIPTTGADLDRAVGLLERGLLAAETAGHPLYAGLRLLPSPEGQVARLFRLCDLMREHRSDAHVSAWRAYGFDALGINVLTELWREVQLGSITCVNMGFAQALIDPTLERLQSDGLVQDKAITPEGREVRDEIERATGRQQASIVEAIGEDVEELLTLLDPWARVIAAIS